MVVNYDGAEVVGVICFESAGVVAVWDAYGLKSPSVPFVAGGGGYCYVYGVSACHVKAVGEACDGCGLS